MWIVRLALRRPYTFVVMSLLILILGCLAIYSTPTDIFPDIDIPIISVIYGYSGLSAEEMADRIVSGFERGLTTTVNDIEHIESQSLNGLGVIKVFSPERAYGPGDVADHFSGRVGRPKPTSGNNSAVYPPIQRIVRAHSSIGGFGTKLLRTAIV